MSNPAGVPARNARAAAISRLTLRRRGDGRGSAPGVELVLVLPRTSARLSKSEDPVSLGGSPTDDAALLHALPQTPLPAMARPSMSSVLHLSDGLAALPPGGVPPLGTPLSGSAMRASGPMKPSLSQPSSSSAGATSATRSFGKVQ